MQKQNGTPKESSWKLNEPDSANDFSLLFDDRRPQENIFSPSKSGSKKRRLSQITEAKKLPSQEELNSSLSEDERNYALNANMSRAQRKSSPTKISLNGNLEKPQNQSISKRRKISNVAQDEEMVDLRQIKSEFKGLQMSGKPKPSEVTDQYSEQQTPAFAMPRLTNN